jgi:hypothetical protein
MDDTRRLSLGHTHGLLGSRFKLQRQRSDTVDNGKLQSLEAGLRNTHLSI